MYIAIRYYLQHVNLAPIAGEAPQNSHIPSRSGGSIFVHEVAVVHPAHTSNLSS